MKVFRPFLTLILILLFNIQLFSAKPRLVSHNSLADFERGKLDGISILTGGKLAISPTTVRLIDTGDPFVWDVVEDSKGNIYIATGNDGRVYKINTTGDSTKFFDAKELQVFALEIDSKNNVYAATFPNGKVYKITPNGEESEFFDPEDEYIWDLLLDAQNNLYVATGQNAHIYKVDSKGNYSIVLESEQKHIRSLIMDKKGTLYAGSSGKGYIYKIAPNSKPYVLHDPQMAEVHSLAISHNGETIYAAAFGSAGLVLPTPVPEGASANAGQALQSASNQQGASEVSLSPQSIIPEHIRVGMDQKTSLLVIDKNGYAKDIWTDSKHQVLRIIADEKDNLIVGTGKEGNVYQIDKENNQSLLFSVQESQVTALAKSKKGRFLVGTSNMGRSYSISSSFPEIAHFESEAIDAGNLSQWGAISWEGTTTEMNTVVFTRSGNTEQPGETWSEWAAPDLEEGVYKIKSPTARFIQWKCDLKSGDEMPIIDKITLSYLQNNLAPEVTAVVIHKPGDFYSSQQKNGNTSDKKGIIYPQPLTQSEYKKGYRSVDWLFQDPNFDGLAFDVYYKKIGNNYWKVLETDMETSVYSWNSSLMEDGEYQIQVVAKDSPSNPENLVLSHKKQSDPFNIDNSGPTVQTSQKKNILKINISDQFSIIKSFHYSIDAGEYSEIYSDDGINDSKVESFTINLPDSKNGETQVTIKVTDYLDNVTVKHVNVN